MWYVFNRAFNKETGTQHDLITKKFNTFDDARAYIRDKTDKYAKFCLDEIGCDSYIEDYCDDVFFNFLDVRITFDIIKVGYYV